MTSWMMCSGLSVRVYMPGRARTGSRPLRTLIDCSSYFMPILARGNPRFYRPGERLPVQLVAVNCHTVSLAVRLENVRMLEAETDKPALRTPIDRARELLGFVASVEAA